MTRSCPACASHAPVGTWIRSHYGDLAMGPRGTAAAGRHAASWPWRGSSRPAGSRWSRSWHHCRAVPCRGAPPPALPASPDQPKSEPSARGARRGARTGGEGGLHAHAVAPRPFALDRLTGYRTSDRDVVRRRGRRAMDKEQASPSLIALALPAAHVKSASPLLLLPRLSSSSHRVVPSHHCRSAKIITRRPSSPDTAASSSSTPTSPCPSLPRARRPPRSLVLPLSPRLPVSAS
jgi:hypothetical protein